MDTALRDAAIAAGRDSFLRTSGRISPRFELLLKHAPDTFAGYGMLRAALMRDTAEGGALDLKTKELIFALLDTLVGQVEGARVHAANAVRQGLTLAELAEGMTQVIMVGGITTWNLAGAEVLAHAESVAAALQPPGEQG